MSSYDHKGVTITVQGGGYYELSHPSLRAAERVRGKEKAEQRADEILAMVPVENDTTISQGDLAAAAAAMPAPPPAPAAAAIVEQNDTKQSTTAQGDPAAAAVRDAELDARDKRIAELEAALAAREAAPTATVAVSEGAVPDRVPLNVPRQFTGVLSDAEKKAMGVKMTRIVLEENDEIPPTGLFISHNFRPYMIVAGEPVDVPDFLIETLDNAKMSAPIVDSKTKKVLGYRDRSRYPYRRV